MSKLLSIEAKLLVNGLDNVVNATLEASENFTSQWREGKTIYCSFTEINGRFGLKILFSQT